MDVRRLMTFGMWGSCSPDPEYNPYAVTKGDTAQQVLLLIAQRPLSIGKIASLTGTEPTAVESELQRLCKAGLVTEVAEGFVASFAVLTAQPKAQVERLTRPKGEIIAKIIQKHQNELKDVVRATSQPSKGWGWERLCWVVIFAILMDTGVVDRGFKRHGVSTALDAPDCPGGGRYWFMGTEGEPPYIWSFGQGVETHEEGGFSYWYEWRQTPVLFAHPTAFGEQVVSVMHTVHGFDGLTAEEISSKAGVETALVRKILESGITWGCVLADGNLFRAHYPLFESSEILDIACRCDGISNVIVENAYLPLLPEIEQIRLNYYANNPVLDETNFITDWNVWVREFALEQLIGEGTLPPFDEPQIAHFWGWKGPWEIF